VLVGGSFCSAKELWICKPSRACVHSINRDCLVGPPPQTLSAKRQRWNPSMRKATRPFLVEIRRGDRHVPKTTTKPNNVAASRTPQPSHFPQNVMRHADQTFDGSHSATSSGLGEPQTSTAPSFGVPPSPAPTGRILPCLLPEPSLDQTSDNADSVRSKRRKRAAAMVKVKSFDADLKGRRQAEFEEPKQSGGQTVPKRHSINRLIPQALHEKTYPWNDTSNP
jgi:hypothetical protein